MWSVEFKREFPVVFLIDWFFSSFLFRFFFQAGRGRGSVTTLTAPARRPIFFFCAQLASGSSCVVIVREKKEKKKRKKERKKPPTIRHTHQKIRVGLRVTITVSSTSSSSSSSSSPRFLSYKPDHPPSSSFPQLLRIPDQASFH